MTWILKNIYVCYEDYKSEPSSQCCLCWTFHCFSEKNGCLIFSPSSVWCNPAARPIVDKLSQTHPLIAAGWMSRCSPPIIFMEVLLCLRSSGCACRVESQVRSRSVFFHSQREERRREGEERKSRAAGLWGDEQRDINKWMEGTEWKNREGGGG